MATYVMLIRYTQQGIQNIKQSPARIDAFRQALQSVGAELKEIYMVMGQYDHVAIIEAPDNATVTKIELVLGSLNNVRTESFPAYSEDALRTMISELS